MKADGDLPLKGTKQTEAIPAVTVDLFGHDRATLGSDQIADGQSGDVIDGRGAFQVVAEDGFAAAIERLTGRSVPAFLSSDQTSPGVASGPFFLEPPPVSAA